MNVLSLYRVENIVAKGEIAHQEQLLLLPQCFQKPSASEPSESFCMWVRVNLEFCIDLISHVTI